jgi:hypothetical protein
LENYYIVWTLRDASNVRECPTQTMYLPRVQVGEAFCI